MPTIQEEGEFEGVIIDHSIGQLNNERRTPYLEFIIESDTDHAYYKKFLSDKALPYTIKDVQRLGFTGEDIIVLAKDWGEEKNSDRSLSLRGVEVKFTIVKDGDYFNVKSMYPLKGGRAPKKLPTEDILEQLSAKSKQLLDTGQEEIPF